MVCSFPFNWIFVTISGKVTLPEDGENYFPFNEIFLTAALDNDVIFSSNTFP
jgi:hypothetical protein